MRSILLLLLLIPNVVFAEIGQVTEQKGAGVIKRDTESIESSIGTGLESMDTVITDSGRLRLDFVDQTRVDVTEHSRLVIDDFVYDPNTQNGNLSIKATLGAVRYASGQIAHNNARNVNIATPSATITVRGTDFMMIVDEIGGSMITLLPSCNTDGMCVVGEISVETDAGFVIMNQAFQTTVVPTRLYPPARPVILDLPENQLTAMLIVRNKSPYDEVAEAAQESVDLLSFDFLKYDQLDIDALSESIKGIWDTDLNRNEYLNEAYRNELEAALKAMIAALIDELTAQNEAIFLRRETGRDPVTGIGYEEQSPRFVVDREDQATDNRFKLSLNQNYGYTVDMQQGNFNMFDYRVGVGNNKISITQID